MMIKDEFYRRGGGGGGGGNIIRPGELCDKIRR